MNRKKRLYTLLILVVNMIFYIAWVFYMSEPKYIDNSTHKLERYDYVSIPHDFGMDNEVMNGIVLQIDDSSALILVKDYRDKFFELDISQKKKDSFGQKKSPYRIVGKGTIYHKVNSYVGFNIMVITQVFMGFLLILTGAMFVSGVRELLKEK